MTIFDTHALLWLSVDAPKMGPKTRRLADRALAAGELCVSAMSFWEVAALRRAGRIDLKHPVVPWRDCLLDKGLREIGVDGRIAIAAAELGNFHGDPFDRIITATASCLGATLVTADKKILEWGGPLRTHDARV